MRTVKYGIVPVKSEFHYFSTTAYGIIRPNINRTFFSGFMIEHIEISFVFSSIDNVFIERVDGQIRTFPSCGGLPIPFVDSIPFRS